MRSKTRLCGVCGFFLFLTPPMFLGPAMAAAAPPEQSQGDGEAQPGEAPRGGKYSRTDRATRAKDPTSQRKSSIEVIEAGFTGGRATADDYTRLLERCSTSALPASAKSRQALGKAIFAATSGATISAPQAKTLAAALDAGVNAAELTSDSIAARRGEIDSTLHAIGASQELVGKVLSAFDRVVGDQRQDDLKPLISALQSAHAGAEAATDGQREKISALLLSVCTNAKKPSQESVEKLAGDLGSALAGHPPDGVQAAEIARALQGLMSSAGLPSTDMSAMIMDLKVNMRGAHVRTEWSDIIITDCKAIYQQLNPK